MGRRGEVPGAQALCPAEAASEAADLFYFGLVKTLAEGSSLEAIESELERRSYKVLRRPGNAKLGYDSSDGGSAWTGIH